MATSTTSSGRTWTVWPSRPTSRSRNAAVCQVSSSSVRPLKVLPTITKPPPSGSRAPRWRLDSQPRRRPWPHSAASTTRSKVCTGLTLRHALPRRPASYGLASVLHHHPLVAGGQGGLHEGRGLAGVGGDQPGHGEPAGHLVERAPAARAAARSMQVAAVDVQHVEEEGPQRQLVAGRDRRGRSGSWCPGRPRAGRRARPSTSPSSTSSSAGSARTTSTTSGSRAVTSLRLRV